ncbi:HNH endonuclease (plasmid) [Tistrella mobilis]|uniref:HNH endonuclease n=1 Tax=Tistrella mobilis TaxID=171437 RepID=UPI003558AD00
MEDHILWSYSVLSISRKVMKQLKTGETGDYPGGRTKAANILMSGYQRRQKNITSLDRDDTLAQDGAHVCMHCGRISPRYHWDHLIPRSRLRGETIPLNQVRSCPGCNLSRGDRDLMTWHRQRQTFPTLGVLRRYIKLCYFYAKERGLLDETADDAVANGLPFDPRELPRRYPPIDQLVWDHAHPTVGRG